MARVLKPEWLNFQRAHHIEGGDGREDLVQQRLIAAGADLKQDECGGRPEADGVAQAIELHAEVARRFRDTRHVAIERVKDHGADDEPTAQGKIEFRIGGGLVVADLAGRGDGGKATHGVSQGQQRWNDGDLLHGAIVTNHA